MQRTSFAEFQCSLARSLDVVGEWWSPLIVARIALGLNRFDDLHRELGVSRKVLAARLDSLVDHGVLERRPYQSRPVRHEYVLTEKGADLVPALMALMAWGDRWTAKDSGPPLALHHRRCGQDVEPEVTCSGCGEPMGYDDVVARAGPGSRVGPGTRLSAERLRQP
jgi:DNA-binding HxlR family transcriptional regulator